VVVVLSLSSASAARAAPAPITVALITSVTGPGASEFQTTPQGFLARIDQQNAEGGVHGHRLVPIVIDDQSNPTLTLTAVEDALSRGAFGIVSESPFMYNAARYLHEQGIPVTGGSFDGPEWGEQPFTNMFAADTGSVDPSYPAAKSVGLFFRSHGVEVMASYGYGVAPSSKLVAQNFAASAADAGVQVGVVDTSVPFGTVDFTTAALVARSKHVDGLFAAMDNASNLALVTAMKDAGVHLKVTVLATGLEPDVVDQPGWSDLQGAYFVSQFWPTQVPTPATRSFQAALAKYAHRPPSQFPTFNVYEGWLGADLFIRGLEAAGPSPSRAGFITDLRKVTSYDGGGLLPESFDYATIFGHDAPISCSFVLRAEQHGFAPLSEQPLCGPIVQGSG